MAIRGSRRRATVVAAVLALVATALAAPALAVGAPPATDANNAGPGAPYGWFEAGLSWRGEFADPDVLFYKGTYYAYSSGAGGRYLGVMTSPDLVHWTIRQHYSTHAAPWAGGPDPRTDTSIPIEIRRVSEMSTGDMWNLNDALVAPAAWGLHVVVNPWLHRSYWAVGVIQIGSTWYSYAPVEISSKLGDGTTDPNGFGRYCLTVSSSSSPIGPFRDITGSQPLYCDPDPGGSIDPAPFSDPHTGLNWLVWRATGKVGAYSSSLKSAQLDAHGRITGPIYTLLTTNEGSWEGHVIENPSMIRWRGRWYLFYSGNWFGADAAGNSPYATGYAICAGPAGPCHRPSSQPLMQSNSVQQGPGGASAFLDAQGNLRLAYAYYWPGENRPNTGIPHPRRMAITTPTWHSDGSLTVTPP